jgi:hypothetical protein
MLLRGIFQVKSLIFWARELFEQVNQNADNILDISFVVVFFKLDQFPSSSVKKGTFPLSLTR